MDSTLVPKDSISGLRQRVPYFTSGPESLNFKPQRENLPGGETKSEMSRGEWQRALAPPWVTTSYNSLSSGVWVCFVPFSLQLSNTEYSITNYCHHGVQDTVMTHLFYNQQFVTPDHHQLFSPTHHLQTPIQKTASNVIESRSSVCFIYMRQWNSFLESNANLLERSFCHLLLKQPPLTPSRTSTGCFSWVMDSSRRKII